MYKCWVCDKEFETYDILRRHCGRGHKIHSSETYVKIKLNGIYPTCACGCGTILPWTNHGFLTYIRGHISRINNNWGHNEVAKKKSKATQKKMYNSGKLIVWNKGLTKEDPRVALYSEKINTPERANKISIAHKGKKKPKHVMEALANGSRKYWRQPKNRKKQSNARYEYFCRINRSSQNGLELKFISILNELNIPFDPQFKLKCNRTYKLYDFYIPSTNTLIEVDGDYYHCNPKFYPNGPRYKLQLENIINDSIKNKLAIDNGYTILRFWEDDINHNIDWVRSQLL